MAVGDSGEVDKRRWSTVEHVFIHTAQMGMRRRDDRTFPDNAQIRGAIVADNIVYMFSDYINNMLGNQYFYSGYVYPPEQKCGYILPKELCFLFLK